jgi:hypothetical protein
MNQKAFAKMIEESPVRMAIAEDGRLSKEAMSLLCRLEHLNNQFHHPKSSDARLSAISVAREMLVEIIEFFLGTGEVETRVNREVLANLVDHTKHVELLLNEQTWTELLGINAEMKRTKDREYTWLGKDFEKTFRELFTVLDRQVAKEEIAPEWKESWTTVVNEFATRW